MAKLALINREAKRRATVAKFAAKRAALKAIIDDAGSKALDKGSKALGKQLGKTKGMFGSFMSEYKKAAGTPPRKQKK